MYGRWLAGNGRGCGGRKNRIWRVIGVTLLAFGICCFTLRAAAGETQKSEAVILNAEPVDTVSMGDIWEGNVSSGDAGEMNPTLPKSREEILIVLDPGHGGEDEGCSRREVKEKEINLRIAGVVRAKLEELGYRVLLTREGDEGLGLEERVKTANDAGADIFVSIHQNASELSGVEGLETWYYESELTPEKETNPSRRLATLIHKFTLESTGAADRELRTADNLYVTRETSMPSCLVEAGFLSNDGECGKLTDEQYQERIAKGIAAGIELYFFPKTMYLTFDDGPSGENTGAVLDILKERDIKATFFVVGENVEKHPEMARRIVEEGHTIGIHCNRHEYETIYESVESYLADFQEAYEIVYETTGVETRLFRFPGGSINAYNKEVYKAIIEEMTDRGFVYFDWNASLEDAVKKADTETLLKNAAQSTLGRKKVVMLAHDIVYQTTLCLEELIDQFPEYEMLPLTEEVKPIQF